MTFNQFTKRAAEQESRGAKPRAAAKALRRVEIDKVTALAILAASAIFAPFAVAILNQAAKIFAH